jgi:hypothetical protein
VDLHYTYDGSLTTSTSWSGDVSGSVSWQYNNDFNKILTASWRNRCCALLGIGGRTAWRMHGWKTNSTARCLEPMRSR